MFFSFVMESVDQALPAKRKESLLCMTRRVEREVEPKSPILKCSEELGKMAMQSLGINTVDLFPSLLFADCFGSPSFPIDNRRVEGHDVRVEKRCVVRKNNSHGGQKESGSRKRLLSNGWAKGIVRGGMGWKVKSCRPDSQILS